MKKIKNSKITKNHLLASLIQSLIYWMSFDLDLFLTANEKDSKKVIKKIGEICQRKNTLRMLINILSNIDADVECCSEKEKLSIYSNFSIESARRVINKPILDMQNNEIKETLINEEQEFEEKFMTSYSKLLDKNDPGYISINISNKLVEILNQFIFLDSEDEVYNIEIYAKIKNQIKALIASIELDLANEYYAGFLLEEISRIESESTEDYKSQLVEDVILQWSDMFKKIIYYCDNILTAIEKENLEEIYEKALELEWVNLSMMYSSFYIMRGYFHLTDYDWVPINIFNVPDENNWEEVIS